MQVALDESTKLNSTEYRSIPFFNVYTLSVIVRKYWTLFIGKSQLSLSFSKPQDKTKNLQKNNACLS